MKDERHSESGSVLYYVLIGIVLFMALNMAFMQTQRTGGRSPNEERMGLYATEIMQYTSGLQRSIRMMRMDGVEFTELSFENPFVAGYVNGADDTHKLFHPGGGGMAYQPPLGDWLTFSSGEWYFPGELCVENVGSDIASDCLAADSPNEDVVVILPNLTESLCTQINELLEITAIPAEVDDGWNTDNRKFTGIDGVSNTEALNLGGLRQGCFEGNGANTPPAGTYHYFHVLWAR